MVTGGFGQAIANAIALRKTPGCYTNGNQDYTVADNLGVTSTIRFYLPLAQTILVAIQFYTLTGYNTAIGANMQTAVAAYINSLPAGQSITNSELWGAALSATTGSAPTFSIKTITAGVSGNPRQPPTLRCNSTTGLTVRRILT